MFLMEISAIYVFVPKFPTHKNEGFTVTCFFTENPKTQTFRLFKIKDSNIIETDSN